jgi:hypothetical protein
MRQAGRWSYAPIGDAGQLNKVSVRMSARPKADVGTKYLISRSGYM